MYGRDALSVCVGMRGMIEVQLDVRGPAGDLHSGSFGGAVPNPVTVLARVVVAGCTTRTGTSRFPASTTTSSR